MLVLNINLYQVGNPVHPSSEVVSGPILYFYSKIILTGTSYVWRVLLR